MKQQVHGDDYDYEAVHKGSQRRSEAFTPPIPTLSLSLLFPRSPPTGRQQNQLAHMAPKPSSLAPLEAAPVSLARCLFEGPE